MLMYSVLKHFFHLIFFVIVVCFLKSFILFFKAQEAVFEFCFKDGMQEVTNVREKLIRYFQERIGYSLYLTFGFTPSIIVAA